MQLTGLLALDQLILRSVEQPDRAGDAGRRINRPRAPPFRM
jgi:hypothetical protein